MGALENKVAVITGAGRGIGRGMALLFAQEGAKVVVNDPGVSTDGSGHDDAPADQVAAEIKAAGGDAVANHDSVATADGGDHRARLTAAVGHLLEAEGRDLRHLVRQGRWRAVAAAGECGTEEGGRGGERCRTERRHAPAAR